MHRAPRDLNHNGTVEPYEDPARSIADRVADLLARMTLEEKAGLLFQQMLGMHDDGSLLEDAEHPFLGDQATSGMVLGKGMNHFNLVGSGSPRVMAEWNNNLQELAASTRLGIPVTLSSDPRNSFTDNPATALLSGAFSQWPESTGLAAIGDEEVVRRYADTVRREYLAVGLRLALHPQVDLATEPRWFRISGTFGEDAELTSRLVAAYVQGLHGGDELGTGSVAAMVKHFPGGGPQQDGEDPHFPYGREQIYPGGRFDHHLRPFEAALAAGATQVMPYYGMPVGTQHEEVGFGFNHGIITGLLREQLRFDGIVCTDWGLVSDSDFIGEKHPARAWGVEHLSRPNRVLKGLHAGVDQFGGESCPELVVDLVRAGRLDESRIDVSAGRLLAEKFRLGLFDDPFVDPDAAEEIVGCAEFCDQGAQAQRRSLTLLKNTENTLPLRGRPRLYVEGVDLAAVAEHAELVPAPESADLALLRIATPHEPRTGTVESLFHSGRLDFEAERLAEILHLLDTVPTVVAIHLERPAVIPEIADRSAALIAGYGAGDDALLDVLFGRSAPEGSLPFQLPRSPEEVLRGKPDVPQESENPLYPFGHGLRY